MHPEQACIALRAHEHREAFFPLDADFALRVTLQQPKLLCSSHLWETCPTPPDADRRRNGARLGTGHRPMRREEQASRRPMLFLVLRELGPASSESVQKHPRSNEEKDDG